MAREDSFAVEGAVDLLGSSGTGPLWGMASADLNATLLAWLPGHEVAEHVNAELDVLVIVLDGHGSAIIDGESHDLAAGSAILIPPRNTPAPVCRHLPAVLPVVRVAALLRAWCAEPTADCQRAMSDVAVVGDASVAAARRMT